MTGTIRTRYVVRLPQDLFFGNGCTGLYLDQAIMEARDRARLYCLPATWKAKIVSGLVPNTFEPHGEVVVCVTRYRPRESVHV